MDSATNDTLALSPGISAEARLLMLAASIRASESKASEAEGLLENKLDWNYLEQSAMANGVAAALVDLVKPFEPRFSSEPGYTTLKQRYYDTVAHNLRLKEELLSLLALFSHEGIEVMPMKGPLLAVDLYPSLAHRAIWDLDLLIEEADFYRVRALLESNGYRPEVALSESELRAHLKSDCEFNFDSADGDVHVELHWNILPSFFGSKLDGPYIWERKIESSFEGQKVWGLPPEVMLLFLCMHGGEKHQWAALKWIADVARLLERYPELDFNRASAEAQRLGLSRSLHLGLYLACVLLEATLPERAIADVFADRTVRGLAGLVRGHLFRPGGGLPGLDEWSLYWNDEARRCEVLGAPNAVPPNRARYYRSILTPEWNDRVFVKGVKLPASFLYLVRPWRLFQIHGSNLLKRTS